MKTLIASCRRRPASFEEWLKIPAFAGMTVLLLTAPAFAQTVELAECKTLTEHVPQADVAYQPGVDVEGNAVVPADVNAASFELPDIMTIPLSVDLMQRLPDPPEGVEAYGSLGFLEVYKDGRILYEGQDWTRQVYAICRGEPVPPFAVQDGQDPADSVELAPVPKETNRYN